MRLENRHKTESKINQAGLKKGFASKNMGNQKTVIELTIHDHQMQEKLKNVSASELYKKLGIPKIVGINEK